MRALLSVASRDGISAFARDLLELGVEDGRRPTVADLPGLIEGASMGAGLGFAFLRHASRTRILVHVVDASAPDPLRDVEIIRDELSAHNPALLEKTTLIVLNKIDRPGVRERLGELSAQLSAMGLGSVACSALGGTNGEGVGALRKELARLLPDAETLSLPTEPAGVVVHRIDPVASVGFEVSREGEGFRVRGKAIERLVHQTDFARDESAERFQHELARQGIESALRKAGCRSGDTVMIGGLSLEWEDPDDAALLDDLSQSGRLERTLVVYLTEFGRTPVAQGAGKKGRDHHPNCFTCWLAGAGVKAGSVYGESDEHGVNVGKDPVHVHDFHATILHLLGLDHERLTFRYAGRDFRLTDVHGNVAKEILA